MYKITSIQPATAELPGAFTSTCHCNGFHVYEIPQTDGLTLKEQDANGATDSGGMYHDAPFDAGDRATLTNAEGLTTGVWIRECTIGRTKMYFPDAKDTIAWIIKVEVPERRRREAPRVAEPTV